MIVYVYGEPTVTNNCIYYKVRQTVTYQTFFVKMKLANNGSFPVVYIWLLIWSENAEPSTESVFSKKLRKRSSTNG